MNKDDFSTVSEFEYEFLIDNKLVVYSFSVDLNKKLIHSEKMFYGKNKKNIFCRTLVGGFYSIESEYYSPNKKESVIFDIYCSPFKDKEKFNKFSKVFILNEISERCSDESEGFSILKKVFNSFKRIITIFPSTRITSIPSIIEQENTVKALKKFLRDFGCDITNIENKKINYDTILEQIPKSEVEEFKTMIEESLADTKEIVLRGKKGMYRLSKNNDGTIKAQKISLKHGEGSFEFDYEEESDGVRRLFDFSPLLIGEDKELLVLIDEIDQSLHTQVVHKLIGSLFNHEIKKKTQYIITSHDINLLDLNLLRQDEIYFIDKDENSKSSSIKGLREYNVRFDKDIIKEYLNNKFGATPKLKEKKD